MRIHKKRDRVNEKPVDRLINANFGCHFCFCSGGKTLVKCRTFRKLIDERIDREEGRDIQKVRHIALKLPIFKVASIGRRNLRRMDKEFVCFVGRIDRK